jgi:hypothetical protein
LQMRDSLEKIYSIDQLESMLIVMAFSVAEHGAESVPIFERVERDLAAMKRAEEVLQHHNVRTIVDVETHIKRAQPMTRKDRDAKGVTRWLPAEPPSCA